MLTGVGAIFTLSLLNRKSFMNQIATINPVVMTMTSREMADLTEKRHDSVKRTIDTLAEMALYPSHKLWMGKKLPME